MRCPKCGAQLAISLVLDEEGKAEVAVPAKGLVLPKGRSTGFVLSGKRYTLSDEDIEKAALDAEYPETLLKYFVRLPGKDGAPQRFPIKQVVRAALVNRYKGQPRDYPFQTQFAKRILEKLGYRVESLY